MNIQLNRLNLVAGIQPAVVKMYDYYQPGTDLCVISNLTTVNTCPHMYAPTHYLRTVTNPTFYHYCLF